MKTILGILILFLGILAMAVIPHFLGAILTKGFPYRNKEMRAWCWTLGVVVILVLWIIIFFGYTIGYNL